MTFKELDVFSVIDGKMRDDLLIFSGVIGNINDDLKELITIAYGFGELGMQEK